MWLGIFARIAHTNVQAFEAVAPNGPLEDPVGRNCLCARSGCYLQVGNHEEALKDAELALKDDKTFIKVSHVVHRPLALRILLIELPFLFVSHE